MLSCWIITNVSEEPTTSIFRAEEQVDCIKKYGCKGREDWDQDPEQTNRNKENNVKNAGPLKDYFKIKPSDLQLRRNDWATAGLHSC
jgi:hypothetical protein